MWPKIIDVIMDVIACSHKIRDSNVTINVFRKIKVKRGVVTIFNVIMDVNFYSYKIGNI